VSLKSARGRTGVISRLIPELKKSPVRADGFYTEDIFENRKRVGYLTKTLQGERRILAKSGLPSELCVERFGVDLQTVETLVVPAIEKALRSADLRRAQGCRETRALQEDGIEPA
jgi:nucleoside-triphosphatase THEP1